jgi:hypothetical protein
MSDFSTFFPGGGGGAAIGQFYLPGSLETYPDIYTATDGSVYLKTGATALASAYPLAKPTAPILYKANQIPGFTSLSSGSSLIDLPGENKFIALVDTGYSAGYWNSLIIDRSNPPSSTTANPSNVAMPTSSVDGRYYAPAVRDRVSGLRYTFSSAADNGNAWYTNGMQNTPLVGQVTGSWPNYTPVGTQVAADLGNMNPGVLPGGTLVANSALYESVYRPTVSGATSTQGFITYRIAQTSAAPQYFTISLEDGTFEIAVPTTTLINGINYTTITQLDNGDIYLVSRYGSFSYAPSFQKLNSNTLQYSEPKIEVGAAGVAFWSDFNVYMGASVRGSMAIQGSSATTFTSFINNVGSTTVSQINEIELNGIGVSPKRYAAQQTDASTLASPLVVPTENQTLYWRIA